MNPHYLVLVRRMFNSSMVPTHTNRHNMREWVRSVRLLGDKWLLAKPLTRENQGGRA